MLLKYDASERDFNDRNNWLVQVLFDTISINNDNVITFNIKDIDISPLVGMNY